ncbi:MAG: cation:proton antiporter, partial [Chloroflexota bacterium]|nr:cation:proton antiporter [Chloroflexota bacterium]
QVLFIGAAETLFMLALGYQVGRFLGWSSTDSVFLGAAISISSSAVLFKMLRDTGRLQQLQGRLIVGILVVEDFIAVILLALLSGYAATGVARPADVGSLAGKLALFTVSALVLGGFLAPRLINFVARYKSQETLLIASLALCFGLALVGEQLGVSAAAGAFLIGTVLGDSEHSEEIGRTMAPVRDMFGAIFFVSIGMLADLSLFGKFIGPALVVTLVFVVGKILANTVATFMAGHDARTAVRVGMGMPQLGEFSLAMAKVGADHSVVGAFLYPVIAVTTATTAFVYPLVFRSADAVAAFLDRTTPKVVKQYLSNLAVWSTTFRSAFSFKSEPARLVQRSGRLVMLNVGIIMVIVAAATVALGFVRQLSNLGALAPELIGLLLGSAAVALCVPSAVVVWKELRTLTDGLSRYVFRRSGASSRLSERLRLQRVMRDTLLGIISLLIGVWSIPFIWRLLDIGQWGVLVPALLLVVFLLLMTRAATRVHEALEESMRRTLLGQGAEERQEKAGKDH